MPYRDARVQRHNREGLAKAGAGKPGPEDKSWGTYEFTIYYPTKPSSALADPVPFGEDARGRNSKSALCSAVNVP
jgi:hypothetical protein